MVLKGLNFKHYFEIEHGKGGSWPGVYHEAYIGLILLPDTDEWYFSHMKHVTFP